ncbi:hypothetical protein [Paenibacillus sp. 2TAB26]|uniref:hypothetical protein n=1 Tax=Paenibacillus sp. 2TAB26 TaxID=3233005 RepID=UPI003F9BF412
MNDKSGNRSGLTTIGLSVGGTVPEHIIQRKSNSDYIRIAFLLQERETYKKTERKSSYMVYDTKCRMTRI